jgi:hypothetical protein
MKSLIAITITMAVLSGFVSTASANDETQAAEQECIEYAKEMANKGEIFYSSKYDEIKVVKTWTKNNYTVVKLGAMRKGSDTYTVRLCRVDEESVAIIPIRDQGFWY